MRDWKSIVQNSMPEAIQWLQSYCRQPSISAQNVGIQETISIIKTRIEQLGGKVNILSDCGGNPVLYGEFEPGPLGDPNKTILFYNHYDVQPPEPLEEWTVPPFGAVVHDGKLFARGVADNKADLAARLHAVHLLKQYDGLPCRVKFMVEGEEEVGSPTLEKYISKYAELFKSDVCIWETWGKNADEIVEMVAGVKGICYMQMWCHSADVDLHSGFGSVADNAAWRLTQALASLRSVDNRILIDGFYDDVVPPTEDEIKMVEELSGDIGKALRETYGVKSLITNDHNANMALIFDPTITICGLESGYYGQGVKTVVPKRAQAKVECRLVPNQDPIDIFNKARKHLDRHGFTDVELQLIEGYPAYRSSVTDPFVKTVIDTARQAYEAKVEMWPNAEGSGPMHLFGKYLSKTMPIVSTGCGWWGCKGHAPDESIRLKDYEQGILHMILLLNQYGGIEFSS